MVAQRHREIGERQISIKASDVPAAVSEDSPPGAILAIEGGDAVTGNPDTVSEFYGMGVRIITLIHYRNNEIGDTMRMWRNLGPGPSSNGLTPAGRKVVERMHDLGIVVDVAHAHIATLKQIGEISSRPLVDSHTNPVFHRRPIAVRSISHVEGNGTDCENRRCGLYLAPGLYTRGDDPNNLFRLGQRDS